MKMYVTTAKNLAAGGKDRRMEDFKMKKVERGIGGAWYIKLRVLQVSKSNSHDVTLVNLSRELTGKYKCEVSAGSPTYHTMIKEAKMEVVGKYVSMSALENFFFNF